MESLLSFRRVRQIRPTLRKSLINNAHVLSRPRSRQPHEEVPLRKKVVRGVVQSQLRGELRALHRSVRLRVAQAKPRFDLIEGQSNPREFLNTHRSLDDF